MTLFAGGREDEFVDRIYAAGARPQAWFDLLEAIAGHYGAQGANIIRQTAAGLQVSPTPGILETTIRFAEAGWNAENSRVDRLLARSPYPGFLTDSDLHTEAELNSLPMYTEFLNPHGAAAGAGTIIQGANDDAIVLAFEGFPSHAVSRAATAQLDALRPHFARAMALSNEVEMLKAGSVLDAFEVMSCAVALLDSTGRIAGANAQFGEAGEPFLRAGDRRIVPLHPRSRRQVDAAVGQLVTQGLGSSIAIHDRDETASAVLHLIPQADGRQGPFNSVAAFAMLARPGNKLLPNADIIAALFDLTPAEAAVARAIAAGSSPKMVARDLGISFETVRTHLKRVFVKASVSRQSQLVALLTGLSGFG
jgi:DNA-binding CsgD family transcriptional regulator